MIIFAALALAVGVVLLAGGRISALLELEVRGRWTIITALAIQVVIVTIAPHLLSESWSQRVHLLTYALAIVFLAQNRHIPHIGIVALGGALNVVAIAANGGTMPASPAALRSAGISDHASGFANSAATAHARLSFLGDIFSVPHGWPFANVFSVGDLVLLAGAVALLVTVCGVPRLLRHTQIRSGSGSTDADTTFGRAVR